MNRNAVVTDQNNQIEEPSAGNPSLTPGRVVFVRSKGEDDAVVRLSSLPLFCEFRRLGIETLTIHPRDGMPRLTKSDCVAFHYNDADAVAALRGALPMDSTVVCLGSDIYSLSKYVDLHDFVSYYLVPTDMHKLVLSAMVYKPVHTLPETIDRLATGPDGDVSSLIGFPAKSSRRVCWFGYAESFEKGMASVAPIIKNALSVNHIDSFSIIVDTMRFYNFWGFDTIEFDSATFHNIASHFDYVILSHFPLDLSVNSLIKSPNKAVTSLFSGLIPLASRTPAYESLFAQLGLSDFLFSSPRELYDLLSRLDPAADSQFLRKSQALRTLQGSIGANVIARRFLDHYAEFTSSGEDRLRRLPLGGIPPTTDRLYFSDHLRGLRASVLPALRNRLSRLTRKRSTSTPEGSDAHVVVSGTDQ